MYNPDARFLLSECLTSEIVFGLKQFEFKKKFGKDVNSNPELWRTFVCVCVIVCLFGNKVSEF